MRGGAHRAGGGTWLGWSNSGRGGMGAGCWLVGSLDGETSAPGAPEGAGGHGTAFGCPACGGGPNEGCAAGPGGGGSS